MEQHEHPRGADNDWYIEHLLADHYIIADPSFSRATMMATHRRAHEDDAARIEAHKIAPFNDRRPRQVRVLERQRPVRGMPNGEIPIDVEPDSKTMITDAKGERVTHP